MKFIKYSLLALLLLLIGAAIFIATIDLNRYKDDIIKVANEKTGRELVIDGDLGFVLSLVPTVAVEGVSFSNADWAASPSMLKVGKFEAQVALVPLLSGQVQVLRILLSDTEINLETNKEGKGNWVLAAAKEEPAADVAEPAESAALPAMSVNEINIKNATLTYKDGKTGKTTTLKFDELTTDTESFDAPIELAIRASYNDIPVEIAGSVGAVSTLMANEPWTFDLNTQVSEATIGTSGKIAQPMDAKGIETNISFQVASLDQLNKLAETELPAIGPIKFEALVTLPEASAVKVDKMSAQAGDISLGGTLSVNTTGERPALTARLTSEKIDLTPFMQEPPPDQPKPDKLFSSEKLPLDSLKLADVDIKLDIKTLTAKENVLNNVSVPVKLNNGRLKINTAKAILAGAPLGLDIDLDGRTENAVLSTSLTVKQLELGKLPQMQTEDGALQGGKTDVTIKAAGKGSSVAAIMAGLNGMLLVTVGEGKIPNKNVDLAGADLLMESFNKLNPLAKEEKYSDLECVVVNFNIKDGIATTRKGIAMQTSKMYIVGDGTINLKTEGLDMGIKPHARQGIGIGVGSLASLMKIKGTLANPKPAVDLGGAIAAGADVGKSVLGLGKSLLGGSKETSEPEQNPCDVALGKAPPPPPPKQASTSKTTTTEKDSTTTQEKDNVVEKAADKVKGVLDGLFGN